MIFDPIRKKLILRRSSSNFKGTIAIPESYKKSVATCMVVRSAADVHHMMVPGAVVFVEQVVGQRYTNLNDRGDFLCRESNIIGLLIRRKFWPIGNSLLFERDRREITAENTGIVESISRFQYQSLFGWVRQPGIPGKPQKGIEPVININSYCKLTQWSENHREIYLDGKAYLIVSPNDLEFEVCNDSLSSGMVISARPSRPSFHTQGQPESKSLVAADSK